MPVARSATSSTRTRGPELVHRVGRQHRWRPHRVGRRQPVQPRYRHAAAGRCELRRPHRANVSTATSCRRPRSPTGGSPSTPSRSRRCIPIPPRPIPGNGTVKFSSFASTNEPRQQVDGRGGLARPLHPVRHRQRPRAGRFRRTRTSGSAPSRRSTSTRSASDSTTARTSRAGRPRRRARSTRPRRPASSTRASVSASRTAPIRSGGGRINTPRPQHPARRDRQPRAQGHRRRRRARGGGFRRAAQRHGRRSPGPRLRGGHAEGGRLLRRTGDLRRPGIGPGRRAGHVEPQRRRRRHRAEPRARPRRCRREDPHLQLVGPDPHGRRRRRLVRHRRYQRQRLGIRGRHARPPVRQPQQHRHHEGRRSRRTRPDRCRSPAWPAFRRTPTSVVVNITATQPQGSGFATAFPTGVALPVASNLNYVAGTTRANLAVVKVGAGGQISLNAAETSVDLIVDVMGCFGPTDGGRVEAIDPVRLVDSRSGLRAPQGPMDGRRHCRYPGQRSGRRAERRDRGDLERHRGQRPRLRVLHASGRPVSLSRTRRT